MDLSAGYERSLGDRLAVTPFLSWTGAVGGDVDGSFGFGVLGEWRVRGAMGLLGCITLDDDQDLGLSLGAALRF